jgi:hypothetical protein
MGKVLRSALAAIILGTVLVPSVRAQDSLDAPARGVQAPGPLDTPGCCNDHIPNDGRGFNFRLTRSAPQFETSAAILFLQPSSGNLIYSTVVNPFPLASPNWSDNAVSTGFTPAFNLGARYLFGSGGDVQFGWTSLNSFDHASVKGNPTPVPVTLPSGMTVTFPTQAIAPSFLVGPPPQYSSATATAHFLYDAINLDSGLLVSAGNHVRMRLFAGAQLAYISENLFTGFLNGDNSISFNNTAKSSYFGAGPRLGMDLRYVAGQFDLLGGFAGTLLIGGMQSHQDFVTYSPANNAAGLTPNTQFITAPAMTRVVPGLDTRVAASYTIPIGRQSMLKFEAGYMAAVYFNAINQFTLTEVENTLTSMNFAEGNQSVFVRTAVETQSNFFLHGPFARFSLQF